MSYFGDHTPAQDILEEAKAVQFEHNLTPKEMVKILLEIVSYFVSLIAE